jgi:hypothetical protein
MASEDITFCANRECEELKCDRNSKRIRLAIPHSFSVFPDCRYFRTKCAQWFYDALKKEEKNE